MMTLLKILFFGGASLLTPNAIDLLDTTTLIQLVEPISAITEGAALEIDVSQYIRADNDEEVARVFPLVFPEACVSAMLHSKFGVSVYLDKVEGRAIDGKKIIAIKRIERNGGGG